MFDNKWFWIAALVLLVGVFVVRETTLVDSLQTALTSDPKKNVLSASESLADCIIDGDVGGIASMISEGDLNNFERQSYDVEEAVYAAGFIYADDERESLTIEPTTIELDAQDDSAWVTFSCKLGDSGGYIRFDKSVSFIKEGRSWKLVYEPWR